jgi:ubiquinone/menaquinone biosynthesis C-methylase UbiE
MSPLDQEYLLRNQYADASKLEARIALHERFSTNPDNLHRWMFDHLRLPPEARVLELGCGPGTLWTRNAHRIPDGWDITLTDFSPGMLEEIRRNLRDSGLTVRFAVVDAQDIPYVSDSFDAVIANFMLYHVPDRPRALAEIARVLRPDGYLYAMTNGRTHMREVAELSDLLAPPDERRNTTEPGSNFTLDNGADQLLPWFPEVEIRRFEDALVVTEAEPLVAYIRSSNRAHEILSRLAPQEAERRVSALRAELERRIADEGAINIRKDPGLFIARRQV